MEAHKYPPPTPDEVFYARTFALVTLLSLGYLLYWILAPFFSPLAWALFIAFLLYPLHAWLVRKLHGRASLSAALLTLATLLFLIGPLAALGAAFVAQVAELLKYAQRITAGQTPAELADLSDVPVIGTLFTWLQQTLGVSPAQLQGWIAEGAQTLLQLLASLGGKIFLGALGTVVGFVLMMFILFFVIRDGQQMLATARALIPLPAAHKARLFDHLAAVTRAMVYGSGVTAVTQGVLISVAFAILGLPSPIVFGVLAALLALAPLVGPPVLWVPAVIVLAAQGRWYAAIFLSAWGIMVSTIDNVLRPVLVSGRAEVGTLTVFIGVLGGVTMFGAIGLFLGPLVLALVIALIRFTLEVRTAETGGPPLAEGERETANADRTARQSARKS